MSAGPAQRSLVLVQPTGLLVAMGLLLGSLLLLLNTLKLADSPTPGRKIAGALLGLGLLLGAAYRRARGNRPWLLRFDREALHRGAHDLTLYAVKWSAQQPARLDFRLAGLEAYFHEADDHHFRL
ncbi:MAG: hypothetical protein EOO62_03275 [Hymenobacter sp.]|nr:MAG: hypothetical protein EOO62_03275 [Hymenobacter sp.]